MEGHIWKVCPGHYVHVTVQKQESKLVTCLCIGLFFIISRFYTWTIELTKNDQLGWASYSDYVLTSELCILVLWNSSKGKKKLLTFIYLLFDVNKNFKSLLTWVPFSFNSVNTRNVGLGCREFTAKTGSADLFVTLVPRWGAILSEKLGGGVGQASWNPYPISDQNLWFSLLYFRLDQKLDNLFQTWSLKHPRSDQSQRQCSNCTKFRASNSSSWRKHLEMVVSPNDKGVVPSKNMSNRRLECKNRTLFQTRPPKRPYPLALHLPI